MELNEFFTRLLLAQDTVFQTFFQAALPNLANAAIADLFSSHRATAVAVDIFRLQNQTEFFSVQSGGRGPGSVIIILGRQKSGRESSPTRKRRSF